MLVPGRELTAPAATGVPDGSLARIGARLRAPWLAGGLLALALGVAYLIVAPPSGDLAAATYRADLFARSGFTIWDNGWYGGHDLLAYSLLAPPLGALLGVRTLLATSGVIASMLFGGLAARAFVRPGAALAASLLFALGYSAELSSGRVPYDAGVAVALASLWAFLWALERPPPGRLLPALALASIACTTSPVAGFFLALAAVATALAGMGRVHEGRRPQIVRGGLALAVAALAPLLVLAVAFPEGGREPFAAGAFWPELLGALAFAAFLPRGAMPERAWRALRLGAAIYALALLTAYLLSSPLGGNAVRLGALFGPPLVLGSLWGAEGIEVLGRTLSWRTVAMALAPVLLYWQLATAIDDQLALAGDPSVHASYYAPLRGELARLAGGAPLRVEVPMTDAHWESAYLPGGEISLARGWERQLDTRYDGLFYRAGLTAAGYRAWLQQNAISYVALPRLRLEAAGREEAGLIRAGLPFLHEVWRAADWRLFAVEGAAPLAAAPARMTALGGEDFALALPRGGSYRVAVRYSPYWAIVAGTGCVREAPGGWTLLSAPGAGRLRVAIRFSLARIFDHGPRCR